MLELTGVCAGYGAVTALWDVSLEIGEREIVALVGANGAGKTTLLRAISGSVVPTAGRIELDGRPLVGLRPEEVARLGIAHVPEGRRLFAGLTVRENLVVGAHARGDRRRLDGVLELFPRLGERLGQVAGSMSGGEQQMCAIARGLMSDPRLLLIDELSLGLAPAIVDQILERLPAIAEAGTSILLVEQDVEAALRVAGRGMVLENGRIAAAGAAGELLADDRVRRAYLGSA